MSSEDVFLLVAAGRKCVCSDKLMLKLDQMNFIHQNDLLILRTADLCLVVTFIAC